MNNALSAVFAWLTLQAQAECTAFHSHSSQVDHVACSQKPNTESEHTLATATLFCTGISCFMSQLACGAKDRKKVV